jgi:hypothetical protein
LFHDILFELDVKADDESIDLFVALLGEPSAYGAQNCSSRASPAASAVLMSEP